MHIVLNYGKKGLPLDLPDTWDITVINKKRMPVLPNPEEAVEQALAEPVVSRPLAE